MNGFEIVHVNGLSAMFMMLGNAGVVPLFFFNGVFVFFPSEAVRPGSLADVLSFFRACASEPVNTFLFVWMWSCFVAVAKDIFEFVSCCEHCVYTSFAKYAFELRCNFFDVRKAGIYFPPI